MIKLFIALLNDAITIGIVYIYLIIIVFTEYVFISTSNLGEFLIIKDIFSLISWSNCLSHC